MAARTTTPLLTTTLTIAAAAAAILVGCTRHAGPAQTTASADAGVATSSGTARAS